MPWLRGGAMQKPRKKDAAKFSTFWSINLGGMPGFWRCANLLASIDVNRRPHVICCQELICWKERWLTVVQKMESFGYSSYATKNVTTGKKSRGCATFVANSLGSQLINSFDNSDGAALAICTGATLVLNCYAPPRADCAAASAGHLNELLIAISWEQRHVWVGDWNVPFEDNWVKSLASDYNLRVASTVATTTRWKGRTVIDYFLHDFGDTLAHPLVREVSDHKIIEATFPIPRSSCKEFVFLKQKPFILSAWLSQERWICLIKEAHCIGDCNGWDEVCNALEPCTAETASPSEDLDQALADYIWNLTMMKLAWTLSKASYLALLEMPDVVTNWQNVKEVTHNANNWRRDRLHAKRVEREFPKFGDRRTMKHRQTLNCLNRTKTLQLHLESRRCDQRTMAMVRKLYPDALPHLPSLSLLSRPTLRSCERWFSRLKMMRNTRTWGVGGGK